MVPDTRGTCHFETLAEMVLWRGAEMPDRVAFTFLSYKSANAFEAEELTYGRLLNRAKSVGAALQQKCSRGDRVLILCPPGFDYISAFFGCQLGGMVAVPAYPPRNAKHMDRLQAIVEDCGAAAILAPSALVERITHWSGLNGQPPLVVAIDQLDTSGAQFWVDPGVRPEDLAFLQYTSGTTGRPKGVMIPHRAVCDNIRRIGHLLGLMAADRSVGWLPPFHDMGLVGNLLVPLAYGVPTFLMAPESFLQRPLRWLEAVSRFEATITTGPNFAWQLCVDALKASGGEAAKGGLKLDSLRKFLTGAERVRPETLRAFAAAFGQFGFDERCMLPVYGMAESVLLSTGRQTTRAPVLGVLDEGAGREPAKRLIACPDDLARALETYPGKVVTSCGPVIADHLLKIVVTCPP